MRGGGDSSSLVQEGGFTSVRSRRLQSTQLVDSEDKLPVGNNVCGGTRRRDTYWMGDSVVLRMQYIHLDYVEIKVKDFDRCSLLDVYVDLLEGAAKKGMFLPQEPSLWYSYNDQSIKMKDDNDLMKLFSLFPNEKLIRLSIGSSDAPCKNLESARSLIEAKNRIYSRTKEAPPCDTSLQERSSHASASTELIQRDKKIPATTARRLGIHVPKAISSLASESGRTSSNQQPSGNLSAIEGQINHVVQEVTPTIAQDGLQEFPMVPQGDDLLNPSIAFEEDEEDSEEELYFDCLYDNGEYYGDGEYGKIKMKEWMLFLDKEHFLDVLRDYCIQEGSSIVVIKAERCRYTAACVDSNCEWKVHSSRLADGVTWAIKSIKGIHSCMRLNLHNPMATPEWAAKKIVNDVRANEEITGKNVNEILFQNFGVNLKKSSLYKTKQLALEMVRGDDDMTYKNLPAYCEVLKRTNPGSRAHCVWRTLQDQPEKPIQFRSIFISLNPMVQGFIQGCRGLIGVDGAHLKAKYRGVVLAAVALDGANEIFPLAYGVYEDESKGTWSSFFYQLKELLKDADRNNWTIISDRQKGVDPALAEVWPSVSRRFCCRHLYANFKRSYPGKIMKDRFWDCCFAYSESAFRKAMEKLEKVAGGKGAVQWLQRIGGTELWARYKYNPDLKSPETTSNFVESFNSTLGVDRCLPVMSLLEGVRRTAMVRHVKRQEAAQNLPANGLTKYAESALKVALQGARSCKVFKASPTESEIKEGRNAFPVNLENRYCLCGEWQISGIPCRHAMRAILQTRGHPENYVSHWFSTESYQITYSVNYRPVEDEEQWEENDLPKLIPPSMKRGVGRPPMKRRRAEGEKAKAKRSRTVRCGKCKAYGHNSKTCKGGLTAKELKEQEGRIVVKKQRKKRKSHTPIQQNNLENEVMSSAPWVQGSQ